MPFDAGNLITLGVVVVVIAAYRYLDRENRSLEKVKKFADRIRDELAQYVDARAEDLKSYGVELDVRQQAAREALKRVQAVEESLASRAGQMDEIARRLADYDGTLSRLMDMSARVDENLRRIHDEGDFTDKVARRVDEARKALEAVEADLPALRERFAEDNAAALDAARHESLATMRAELARASEDVERLRADAESQADKVAARYAEAAAQAKAKTTEIEALLGDSFRKARAEAEKLEDSSFEKLREQIDERGRKLQEAFESKFTGLRDQAREKVAETQGLLKAFKAEWKTDSEAALAEAAANLAAEVERVEARIEQSGAKLEGRIDGAAARLDTRLAELDESLRSSEELVGVRLERIEAKALEVAEGVQVKVKEALRVHQDDYAKRQAELKTSLKETLAEGRRDLDEAAAALEKRGADLSKAVSGSIEQSRVDFAALDKALREAAAQAELRAVAGADKRFQELEKALDYRYERLEATNADIGRMEGALREAMERVRERVEEDFSRSAEGLEARRQSVETELAAREAELRARMGSLEKDLNVLKSQAYDNVSEKLKVFEDEFFEGLRKRGEDIDRRLSEWRAELETRLEAAVGDAERERIASEARAADEARERVALLQARVGELVGALDERTQAFGDSVAARIDGIETGIASFRANVERDFEEARVAASTYSAAELERWKLDSGERLRQAEREQASRIEAMLAADAEAREAAFARRDEVGKRLSELATELDRVETDLARRAEKALDEFERKSTLAADEARKKALAIEEEVGRSVRSFREDARKITEEFAAEERAMQARLAEETKERESALSDIDRQLKGFIAQTKLFERADELRDSLAESVEGLKADLARLESRRPELVELENQLGKIKRLEDELNQKLGRFLAEKRRIDSMDEDFKRLLGVSQSVDQKLAQIVATDDELTRIQAEMRRLSEAAEEAREKYERVEKKSGILDATADAVDKNFQLAQTLERSVDRLEGDLVALPARIQELERSVSVLAQNKEKAEAALGRLDELDGVLKDTEARMEKLSKAREWLARTETRLEEINKQATEQLKLLNGLLKEEVGTAKDRGAPPVSVQETVRKLARQGWKADEIARATKLSRGEVELILELGGSQ